MELASTEPGNVETAAASIILIDIVRIDVEWDGPMDLYQELGIGVEYGAWMKIIDYEKGF